MHRTCEKRWLAARNDICMLSDGAMKREQLVDLPRQREKEQKDKPLVGKNQDYLLEGLLATFSGKH